jgi:predicted dehydrogenase
MGNQEIRIGIVGCGGISRAHVGAYNSVGGTRITQVFDVYRASAEALANDTGATVADSIEAMIQSGEVDAISICTPPSAHLENALPFLEAGIPILCEKPFELNLEGALELEAAIRRTNTIFMIAFCHRFHPPVLEAKRLLTEEAELVGEPLFFRNIFGGAVDISGGHRSDPALSGGGALIDNCSHSLDLFRFLVDEIDSVSAQTANLVQSARIEDFASVDVKGVGSSAGQICSSYSLPVIYNTVEIHCSKSLLTINYWVPNRPEVTLMVAGEASERVYTPAETADRFMAEITHFLDCVRTGNAPSPGVADAVASSRVIEAAYRSAREGQRISVQTEAAVA